VSLKDNPDGLPIIGSAKSTNSLLSTHLYATEIENMLKNTVVFSNISKINELRKSCGVEPQMGTIKVNIPPRYRGVP
jgi:hypothetical protein